METAAPLNCVVLCGTTASGKTALGVRIAKRLDSEIISADSRQVYRGMDLGTGKDLAEYVTPSGKVPCHLIDIVDPNNVYTLHHFQRDFKQAFEKISSRGKVPVVVGGSGLYLEAALRGYDIPNVPEDESLRQELMNIDKEELIERLRAIDVDRFGRTDLSSKKRIVRGLEVAIHGTGPSERPEPVMVNALVLCVRYDRQVLRNRIRTRLMARLEAGMVNEVKKLINQGVSRERLDRLGLEYRHLCRFVHNEIPYETMVEELNTAIGQFAKRQDTWFRGMERRGTKIHWIDNGEWLAAEAILVENGF